MLDNKNNLCSKYYFGFLNHFTARTILIANNPSSHIDIIFVKNNINYFPKISIVIYLLSYSNILIIFNPVLKYISK
jgi:hypothetical protein